MTWRSKTPAASLRPSDGVPRSSAWRSKLPVLRFVGVFAGIMIVFYVVTAMAWYRLGVFPRYLALNAQVSATILSWLGEDAASTGATVTAKRFSLVIKEGCDAIEPSALFASAVLAFPSPWRKRLVGAAIGIAALLLINLARILTLYYVGVFWPDQFEAVHVHVWQPLFIFFALAIWLGWALWATSRRLPPEAGTAGPLTAAPNHAGKPRRLPAAEPPS